MHLEVRARHVVETRAESRVQTCVYMLKHTPVHMPRRAFAYKVYTYVYTYVDEQVYTCVKTHVDTHVWSCIVMYSHV